MQKEDQNNNTQVDYKTVTPGEFILTYTEDGMKVKVIAEAIDPRHGTGNDFDVTVERIYSGSADVTGFFENHGLIDIIRYDMQEVCREHIHVDMEEIERKQDEQHREYMERLWDSYS